MPIAWTPPSVAPIGQDQQEGSGVRQVDDLFVVAVDTDANLRAIGHAKPARGDDTGLLAAQPERADQIRWALPRRPACRLDLGDCQIAVPEPFPKGLPHTLRRLSLAAPPAASH